MDREEDLVRRTAWQLKREGYIVSLEVPVGTRSVDLFCVDRESGVTLAIEAKLRDWRRAVRQAGRYKFAADFAYVVMPEKAISDACVAACREAGVGLISVPSRGMLSWRLSARPHKSKRTAFSRRALVAVGPSAGFAAMVV